MKKILSLFVAGLITCLSIQAQTPQAVCYQAAAKDNQGADLIGQDIAIRAAVVKDGPNGTVEWEEVHTPTTDQFGLFNIEIGEGNPTGNGAQTDFADIDWGNGTYWLRIEMDPTAGSDFVMMGATQIVSVPYALHAESAATAIFADSASVANNAQNAQVAQVALDAQTAQTAVFADSAGVAGTANTANTSLTANTALDDSDRDSTNELQELVFTDDCVLSISGGNSVDLKSSIFGAAGASPSYPQGILGSPEVLLDQSYTVPAGKNLYLTAAGPSMTIKLNGADFNHPTTPNMPVIPPGAQIENCFCTAILIDAQTEIEAVIVDLNSAAGYTVPAGKSFFVKSGIPNSLPGMLIINGHEMEFFRPNLTRGSHIITLPENAIIQRPQLYSELVLTGFLLTN